MNGVALLGIGEGCTKMNGVVALEGGNWRKVNRGMGNLRLRDWMIRGLGMWYWRTED